MFFPVAEGETGFTLDGLDKSGGSFEISPRPGIAISDLEGVTFPFDCPLPQKPDSSFDGEGGLNPRGPFA